MILLGDVTKVDVNPTWDGFPEPVRNASGDLFLITWDDLNGPGELIR